jgi:hypothetical protein
LVTLLAFVYHCFDRIVINGYLNGLSRPEQVVRFVREDRSPENPLKRPDQPWVLGTTLLHTEDSSISAALRKLHCSALFSKREGGKKNRHQTILPPWQTVAWVAGSLQNEVPVSPLVHERPFGRLTNWQSAEDKRP